MNPPTTIPKNATMYNMKYHSKFNLAPSVILLYISTSDGNYPAKREIPLQKPYDPRNDVEKITMIS